MLLILAVASIQSLAVPTNLCDVSPNCRARLREECAPPHRTCGPCLPSFASTVNEAHANTPCETSLTSEDSIGMGELPVVDVSKLKLGGTSRAEEIQKLKQALFGPGFMYLSNSGVAIDSLMGDMRHFFGLPLEEKMRSAWTDPAANSGYVKVGGEGLDEDSAEGDPKESYDMNKEHLQTSIWKNTSAVDYWQAINSLKEVVLGGYEEVLGLEIGYFQRAHDEEFNNLRLLHYLPLSPTAKKKARYRVGPHSDYGSITLLVQDPVGGLQVLDRITGRWRDAVPIPGTVLCNTADLMMRWTNDHLPSTLHRVVGPGEQGASQENNAAAREDRYSVVFFVNPNKQHFVENLMVGEVAKYPGVPSLDYLVQRLSATFENQVDPKDDSKRTQEL